MRYAVRTTHAVPDEKITLHLVKTTTLLVCPDCHESLGTYTSTRERSVLQACHFCKAKQGRFGPSSSEPYN